MINGWTSRIQMVGAILILLVGGIGIIYLSAHDRSTPTELVALITGAGGFLYGTTNRFPASGDPVKDVLTGKKAEGGEGG